MFKKHFLFLMFAGLMAMSVNAQHVAVNGMRSEERRVGKECSIW